MSGATTQPRPVGTIWHMLLNQAPQPVEPLLPATFCRAGSEELAELARAMGLADPAEVQMRFDSGRRCYAARAQDSLAAYGWVSFKEETIGSLGLRLTLRPGEAYIWDCATLPAFRRQGLYPALLRHIVKTLRDEGLQGVWIGADYANQPSHAGINRAGFTVVADLVVASPLPGERRRRGWLEARPSINPERLAEARRVYLSGRDQVWLFENNRT